MRSPVRLPQSSASAQEGLFDLPELPELRTPPVQRADGRSIRTSPTTEIGQAAEHLVCADLLLTGWTAYLAGPGVPYDIMVDTGRARLRVQVKSTLVAKTPAVQRRVTPAYFFHSAGSTRKRGKRIYGKDEIDVFALVALDRRLIAYFAACELPQQQVVLRVPGLSYGPSGKIARDFEGATFSRAIEAWESGQS
jgi:hypothetical protein